MAEFEFDLLVSGLTQEQCQDLLIHIAAEVDELGGEVAGGFKVAGAAEVGDDQDA